MTNNVRTETRDTISRGTKISVIWGRYLIYRITRHCYSQP